MSASTNAAPIIIKRKKVIAADGHHGGAWKVAYADFVTAMMAFFMLMWLLNATTEQQRTGLADYFSPTISINRISSGGDGSFGGETVFSEKTSLRNGTGASNSRPTDSDAARGWSGVDAEEAKSETEQEQFVSMEEQLLGRGGESMLADDLLEHIVTKVTDEGLVIEVHDLDGAPLFTDDMHPTPTMVAISQAVFEASKIVTNPVAIEGHVRSLPLVLIKRPVWDQSSSKADSVRRLLEFHGLAEDRLARITGHADRELARKDPMAIQNNRIEMIFLRTNI